MQRRHCIRRRGCFSGQQQAGNACDDQHGAGDDDSGRGALRRTQIRRVDRALGVAGITLDDDMLVEVVAGIQRVGQEADKICGNSGLFSSVAFHIQVLNHDSR